MTLAFGPLPAVGRRPYTADVQAILDQFADDVNLAFASLPVVSGAPLIANQMADVGWDYAAVLSNIGVFSTVQSDARYALNAQQIIAGTGLTGGGTLAADRTLSLANTAVTPGTYGDATHSLTATVNQQGQITALTAVAISGGGGGAVTSVNTRTGAVVGLAEAATTITAGTGLSGGGDLSANRTLSLPNVGTAATTGDASHVGQFTTDAQGRVSAATAVAIALAGTAITSGTVAAARLPTLDAIGAPVANVSLNSQRITNLADPVGAQDVATKHYVDTAGPVLSVNTRTGAVTGLAEASQIVGLLGNTGGWTLGTNTDIYLPASSWSGGALTGGVIQQATTMKLGSTYTQTSDPTNISVGTSLYINWNPTLNNTGAASQTGFFGPRGVIQTEGTVTWQKTSGFLKIAPVGYAEQLIQKNQPGSAMDIYGSWGIILNRIWEADGATVTLHGNDTAHGHTSIIDNGVYFTKNAGTLDGATHSFEHVGFLSAPCIIGNTTISRVAYDVADFSTGSGQVAIIGGQSWGTGADADAHSVPQNIGLRIQPLTHGVTNIGILSQSSVIVSDGTDAHGSTLIDSGLAFGVPISGISAFANATDANPVVQIISNGGIGQLRFGPGAGSLTDFVIARTGAAAAAVTGTLTLPSPIFTSPVVIDGTFTISDGTAGHGKVFGSVSAIGPGFNLFANTADTQAAGLFAIVSGVPTLAFGPGGTTVRDVKVERTGSAAALATGVFTFTSPVFAGAPIVTGGVLNVSDGTAGHGSVNLGVGVLGAAVQVFANTADTTVAAQLGATGLQIGPGGSTATDFKFLRTGTAAGAITGVVTMTSPVINTGVSGSAIDTDSTFATGASTTVTASSAVKTALALKAPINNAVFTGTTTLAADPTAALHAATKQYVDNAIAGLGSKTDVAYVAASALPANTYANGASGVGATLTGNSNGPLVIDGVTIVVGQVGERVLVAAEGTSSHNGWYTITTIGVVAVSKYVLTRATDSDEAAEIGSGYITTVVAPNTVTAGTNNGTVWLSIAAADPFVVGTTNLTFSKMGNVYSAGTGLSLSGTTFSIDTSVTVDKTTAQTLTNKTLTAPAITSPTGIVVADIPDAAPLASPTFTGTIAATGGALNMTDGTNAHGEIKVSVGAFGPNIQLYTDASSLTNVSAQLAATGLSIGPGTGATDVRLLRTGTSAAAFTGVLTMTSPVISGHATIEGVTPTGATGTGKLVFDGTPTLVTPVIGVATGTSLAVTGAVTSSGTGGVGYATGAGGAVTQLTSKTTAFPTISKTCGTLTWNNAALASDTSVTSASSTNAAIAATDIVCFTHISGGTIGAYIMTCTPAAGTWTLTLRNTHSGSLSEAPVFAFAIIKGVTS